MVAEQVEIPELEDVDLMEIIQRTNLQACSDNADTENAEEVALKEDREGMQTFHLGLP